MSIVEITGFVFGIAGIWLTIREHWSCFPVGLVNVSFSLWLFLEQKLYSDTVQQGVYIILLSYGWYNWRHHARETRPRIGFMDDSMKLYLMAGLTAVSAGMGYFFDRFTDADVPYIDAIATALSFTAQFLIARKKIENWLIWMVVNVLYIGIYTYKELYLYAILFALYFILSVKGYLTWKKTMQMQKQFQ
jgi:nicotinamide mononucleotide transporter